MAWDPDYIDFIYNYCDRWCERCPLTHRCVVFARENDPEQIEEISDAVEKAMEELRVELAMPEPPARPWLEEILNAPPPAPAERREMDRDFEERRRRLESNPMRNVAMDYAVDSRAWLGLYEEATQARVAAAAPTQGGSEESAAVVGMEIEAVLDALRVVRWDGSLIAAKLGRALSGKEYGAESLEDDPVQTDFNGSAKVTLLLLERSEAAWHLIVRWAPEREIATQFANTLAALRGDIERAFPHARRFVRPGFDELAT
jgi:hypothetical protein